MKQLSNSAFAQPVNDGGGPDPARCIVRAGRDQRPSLAQIESVALGLAQVDVSPQALPHMAASAALLDDWVEQKRCIYGVTTGYGPLATTHIDPARSDALQRKLVYHLATGVGEALPWAAARAIMFCRLQALSQGMSAVSPRVIEGLVAALNAGLAPVIPEKGTVGASGDLTPLAHMALALMGEGAWIDRHGPVENSEAFTRMGTAPLALGPKQGLALVNGTSAMTGIAALNGAAARRLLKLGCVLSLMNAEVFKGHSAAWHPLVGAARGQPGQSAVHALLWPLVESAPRLQAYCPQPSVLDGEGDVRADQPLPQDPYSIRCIPQLMGACLDMLETHDGIAMREASAVTDNPLIFAQESALIHAGNFFGQHVAFASDALTNAVIMIATVLERQIARITDVSQNGALPAFLQGRQTGLNSGFMGAQVTATALVAEMKSFAIPASIQSIPTNANNQDVVTMGTIAARKTATIIKDAMRVAAIHALCMAQAVDLCDGEADGGAFSPASHAVRNNIRALSPFLGEDRPLSADIEKVAAALEDTIFFDKFCEDMPAIKSALSQF